MACPTAASGRSTPRRRPRATCTRSPARRPTTGRRRREGRVGRAWGPRGGGTGGPAGGTAPRARAGARGGGVGAALLRAGRGRCGGPGRAGAAAAAGGRGGGGGARTCVAGCPGGDRPGRRRRWRRRWSRPKRPRAVAAAAREEVERVRPAPTAPEPRTGLRGCRSREGVPLVGPTPRGYATGIRQGEQAPTTPRRTHAAERAPPPHRHRRPAGASPRGRWSPAGPGSSAATCARRCWPRRRGGLPRQLPDRHARPTSRHLMEHPGFRLVRCDVTDFVHVPGQVDLVLHFASPASPDRLPADADRDPQGRQPRHAARPGPGQGEGRPLRARLDLGGVRRPAGAPAAGELLGQRQPGRPARGLRRGASGSARR